MSWDLIVQYIPPQFKSINELPLGFKSQVIGNNWEISRRIREVVPFVDFSDREWGVIHGPDISIDINFSKEELVETFSLHVSDGEISLAIIHEILEHLQLRAIDLDTGEIFTPEVTQESLQQWHAYRNSMIGSASE